MPQHKLFGDSPQVLDLNISMESRSEDGASSLVIVNVEEVVPKDEDDRDDYEIFTSQNSIKSEKDDIIEEIYNFSERRPYSSDEDMEILSFVLKDQNIYKVSSILLWKFLETKKKNPKRSYQSLKNRFLRNIKPKIFTTYRHLIKNQEQVKKIIDKFPELKKDVGIKPPLLVDTSSKKVNDKILKPQIQSLTLTSNETAGKNQVHTQQQTSTSTSASQVEKGIAIQEESGKRKVVIYNNSVYVVVSRNSDSHEPPSTNHVGIYEKYLNCKAENKLIACPTCGRCGGPELDLNEGQDSENENDAFISNSVRNTASGCSQDSADSANNVSPGKRVAATTDVVNGRSKRTKSQSEISNISKSPSLLDGVQSPERTEMEGQTNGTGKRAERSGAKKTTSLNTSKRKVTGSEEQPPGDLTDEELESLYQESVQKCEKLMSSEEEEALVKKCFKKNRRSIGFDSYVLINKANVDSFFARSQSPPLDGLSSDPVPSQETTGSPLVENMKRMLRPRNHNKS